LELIYFVHVHFVPSASAAAVAAAVAVTIAVTIAVGRVAGLVATDEGGNVQNLGTGRATCP
jgi:hypothetical protein